MIAIRLTPNGSPDKSFDGDGFASTKLMEDLTRQSPIHPLHSEMELQR